MERGTIFKMVLRYYTGPTSRVLQILSSNTMKAFFSTAYD